MTEQSETSFANDGRSCQQTSATQNFVVGYVVVPSDVEDPPLTPHVERLQSPPVQLRKGPSFRAVEEYRQRQRAAETETYEILFETRPRQSKSGRETEMSRPRLQPCIKEFIVIKNINAHRTYINCMEHESQYSIKLIEQYSINYYFAVAALH